MVSSDRKRSLSRLDLGESFATGTAGELLCTRLTNRRWQEALLDCSIQYFG